MSNKVNKIRSLKSIAGQNTAEYLIMLVLISVGSIGVFSVFGGTIRNQVSSVVSAFGGKDAEYGKAQVRVTAAGGKTEVMAGKTLNMSGVDKEEVKGFDGK